MTPERHPRLDLHEAIADALSDERMVGAATGGVVTRWVLVGELALPDANMALITVSSTSSGHDLRTWEQTGLLGMALHRALRNGGP